MAVNNFNNNIDEFYMRRALELAKLGMGFTAPNPLVGCVIVKDNEIIGEGWHEKFGEPHAEINALSDAARRGHSVNGSTLYVTLEPCCHLNKKTPPCAQRLVKEKVARVVAAMSDPNPNVNNKGFDILREAGIEVTCGCLENEARWLNRGFIKAQEAKRPWVSLKAACRLDGCMAVANG
ncbi:MAG: bifunctional diaminohydroxyphosphoribosylaminopyrimidine deaminase/5-amino-6-(5-phosphoribosylamino)uracil reductase RibD, partial [Synergistaceae bacterium]|nr:bifunctional diaminohydroxyphosphoribosylaminopyrimidine deaminase/5-amino-6-(5-phosphoribosylamino)uracil reductase RibD [Synergistaceae bacterium]